MKREGQNTKVRYDYIGIIITDSLGQEDLEIFDERISDLNCATKRAESESLKRSQQEIIEITIPYMEIKNNDTIEVDVQSYVVKGVEIFNQDGMTLLDIKAVR